MSKNNEDETFQAFEDYCAEIAVENKAWRERWPNHCQTCEGAGGFHHPGNRETPPDFDICECSEAGKCPRCMELAWPGDDIDDVPCPHCGWNWCKGKDDAAPQW